MWLTRFALRQPTIVTLFFLAVAIFGTLAYILMGQNIIPNVTFPFVGVTAFYPGASPQEIERLVIQPIEDQLQDVRHVDHMIATGQDGQAFIGIIFKLGTNIDSASADVQQAVNAARANLPSDLDPPIIERADPSAQPILIESITSSTLSPIALSNLVEREIIPDLRSVKGVGTVFAGGKYVRQVTVQPDPGKLRVIGATLLDVSNSVGQGNVSFPGGRLDQPFQESTVGVRADITSPLQIERLPLMLPGRVIEGQLHVGDIAQVIDGEADHRIISMVDGRASVVLYVSRDSDGDTKNTTAAVRDEFKKLQDKYPQVNLRELDADYNFMHDAIGGVFTNLSEGVILTALVLLLFLHIWRSALVVMIAIPASLLATFFVMWAVGFTVDLLSLMGLSLIIGILVDDSIVVIENITRHRDMGKPPDDAAIVGRSEIGGAAIAITLVDVIVFAPIAFMTGIIGEYLREFGLVVVVATLFSLLVSFTLTPLLSAHWSLARRPGPPKGIVKSFLGFFERVRSAYHDRALPWALRHPYLVFWGSGGLVAAAVVATFLGAVPAEFQPYTEWGGAIVNLQYRPGTPLEVTRAGAERLSAAIQKMDGIRSVAVNVGQSAAGFTETLGGYVAQVTVILDPAKRHQEHKVVAAIEQLGYLVPGARLQAAGAQSGGQAGIIYTLSGPPDELDAAAGKLKGYIARLPGTTDVQTSSAVTGPRLEIAVDRDRAALLSVSPQAAAATARAAIGGVIATKLRMPEGLVDTLVQLPQDVRNDVHSVQALDVRASDGMLVPLVDVARFNWTKEAPTVERQNRERIVRVMANTVGNAPTGPVSGRIDAALKQRGFLPAGVNVKPEGETKLLGDAIQKIGIGLVTSFVLIYMLLVVLYRSYVTPIVIMVSVPVAMVGAIGILMGAGLMHLIFPESRFFAGQTLNIFSMLGLVMLMGLVAKNGILLVDYANTLRGRGMVLRDAMLESAFIRFRPIIMTTAAMIMGMLPLALGLTEGAEFRKSIGTIIIGGLTSSLFLTLFLVPVVYEWWLSRLERWTERRRERRRLALIVETEEAELAGS